MYVSGVSLSTALAETVAQNTNTASQFGGWGGDNSYSPIATRPWFYRGGESGNGANAGIFTFSRVDGGAAATRGWRAVLSEG